VVMVVVVVSAVVVVTSSGGSESVGRLFLHIPHGHTHLGVDKVAVEIVALECAVGEVDLAVCGERRCHLLCGYRWW
jgi:hypothetical protein